MDSGRDYGSYWRAKEDAPRHFALILSPCLVIGLYFYLGLDEWLLRVVLAEPASPMVMQAITAGPVLFLLALGVVWGCENGFDVWAYPWIGMLFYFCYQELSGALDYFTLEMFWKSGELLTRSFNYGIVPLALAGVLLPLIRADWLMACLAVYPCTSILVPWYTLQWPPVVVLAVCLVLYAVSIYIFLSLRDRVFQFITLFAGTLIIGGGFYLWLDDPQALFVCTLRNLLILLLPPMMAGLFPFRRPVEKTIRL